MGIGQLFVSGDAVTDIVALLLLLMSVASWVLIFWKGWLLRRAGADVRRSTLAFWQSTTLDEGQRQAQIFDREALVVPLIAATRLKADGTLASAGDVAQQLTRVLRQALHAALRKLQFGQVLL
ncbi:MAG: MotA/TolQ/ExbB proton channel family protein, partial [Burkholderiaceae bacterium]